MGKTKYREIRVGIADYKIAKKPDRLITLGLGSCVGVGVYDPVTSIAGLIHLMLPDSTNFKNTTKKAKFADLGIPLIIQEMKKKGAAEHRLIAKLVGGAQMFKGMDEKLTFNIGKRNVQKAREMLKLYGVRIVGEDVGGNKGRTMILDTCDGRIYIKTLGKHLMVI